MFLVPVLFWALLIYLIFVLVKGFGFTTPSRQSITLPASRGMYCTCKTTVSNDFKYCPNCGGQIKKYCSRCGGVLEPNWKYCAHCGQ